MRARPGGCTRDKNSKPFGKCTGRRGRVARGGLGDRLGAARTTSCTMTRPRACSSAMPWRSGGKLSSTAAAAAAAPLLVERGDMAAAASAVTTRPWPTSTCVGFRLATQGGRAMLEPALPRADLLRQPSPDTPQGLGHPARLGLEGVRNHGTVCGSGERRMGVIRREAVHVHCH